MRVEKLLPLCLIFGRNHNKKRGNLNRVAADSITIDPKRPNSWFHAPLFFMRCGSYLVVVASGSELAMALLRVSNSNKDALPMCVNWSCNQWEVDEVVSIRSGLGYQGRALQGQLWCSIGVGDSRGNMCGSRLTCRVLSWTQQWCVSLQGAGIVIQVQQEW